MSGIAAGKAPSTDAQWARDVQQTLDSMANPLTQRVGNWVISQASDGSLQATAPDQSPIALGAASSFSNLTGTLTLSQLPSDAQTIVSGFQSLQTLANTLLGTDGDLDSVTTWLNGLNTSITTNEDNFASMVDSWISLLGGTSTGNLNSDLDSLYTQWANMLSWFGSPTGSTTTTDLWTEVVNSILNPLNAIETQAANIVGVIDQDVVSGVTTLWDWLSGTAPTVTSNASNAAIQSTSNTNALQAIAANPPGFVGLQPGTQSNITLPAAGLASLIVHQADEAVIGFTRIQQPMTVGAIAFIACGPEGEGLTDYYVNFYTLDPITGDLDYLFSSANIATSIPVYGAPDWVEYEFPGPDQISATAGQVLAVEFQAVSSTGNPAYVYGQNTGVPNRTSALMQNVGGSRTAPGSSVPTGNIASTGFAFTPGAPYVALEATDLPPDYEPPTTYSYFTPGTYTLPVPAWANYIDRIVVGSGGGAGGGINGAGYAGADTTITAGADTLTGAGGAGGIGGDTVIPYCYGQSPGNETYNGQPYFGGTQVNVQTNGASPGGGGGGGQFYGLVSEGGSAGAWNADTVSAAGITSVTIVIGDGGVENTIGGTPSYGCAPGAPGGAWVVFRQ